MNECCANTLMEPPGRVITLSTNSCPITRRQLIIGRISLFSICLRSLIGFCLRLRWPGKILPTASLSMSVIAAFVSVLLTGSFETVDLGSAQQQAGFLFMFLCMFPDISGCSAGWNEEVVTGYRSVWSGGTHVSSNIKCTSRVYMALMNGVVHFGYWFITHNVGETNHSCNIHNSYSDAILVDCCLLHTSEETIFSRGAA